MTVVMLLMVQKVVVHANSEWWSIVDVLSRWTWERWTVKTLYVSD